MVKRISTSHAAIAISASFALAGCLGSGGGGGAGGGGGTGGGGGGAGTVSQHDARYDQLSAMVPTTDMPTTGSANYAGSVKTTLNEGSTPIGTLLADVEMQLNFGQAFADSTAQSVSGRVHNIRGRIGDEDVAFDAELTTVAAAPPSTMNITQTEIAGRTLATGAIMANFAGDVTVEGETGQANLLLGGTFVGSGAQAAQGPAAGSWWRPGGLSDYSVGGTWYAERQ